MVDDAATGDYRETRLVPVNGTPGTPGATGPGIASFFGGVLLGALLSATFGWDLIPEPRRDAPAAAGQSEFPSPSGRVLDLENQLRRLKSESGQVAEQVAALQHENSRLKTLLEGAGEPEPVASSELLPTHELLVLLHGRSWNELERAAAALLKSGEAGFAAILGAVHAVFRREDRLDAADALPSILRIVARNEREVAALIDYALVSETLKKDPLFAERVLSWSARFFAGVDGALQSSPARSALVQILQKRLQERHPSVWLALEGLEALKVEVPEDTLERLLEKDPSEGNHGVILTHLGLRARRGSREALEFLVGYVRKSGEEADWRTELALEMIAETDTDAARKALAGFLESTSRAIRQIAHQAYFSRPRPRVDIAVLVSFLESDATLPWKRTVLNRIRFRSPEIFKALCKEPELISDAFLQGELRSALVSLPVEHSD